MQKKRPKAGRCTGTGPGNAASSFDRLETAAEECGLICGSHGEDSAISQTPAVTLELGYSWPEHTGVEEGHSPPTRTQHIPDAAAAADTQFLLESIRQAAVPIADSARLTIDRLAMTGHHHADGAPGYQTRYSLAIKVEGALAAALLLNTARDALARWFTRAPIQVCVEDRTIEVRSVADLESALAAIDAPAAADT